jgi:hypothetical protein
MSESAQIAEVMGLLHEAMAALHPVHREALGRALIPARALGVDNSPGEFVIAVAKLGDSFLYWSEIEEGWELAIPSQAGTIPSRGCNQFELKHVLYQALGDPNAV